MEKQKHSFSALKSVQSESELHMENIGASVLSPLIRKLIIDTSLDVQNVNSRLLCVLSWLILLTIASVGILSKVSSIQIIMLHESLEDVSALQEDNLIMQLQKAEIHNFGLLQFYVMQEFRLLICGIPKAGSQSMRTFAADVENCPYHDNECGRVTNSSINLLVPGLQKIIEDSEWKKITFFRLPTERLLSGYLNKCFRECCVGCPHFRYAKKPPTFAKFITRLRQEGFTENPHFTPQSWQCGGISEVIGYYDFIGLIGEMDDTYDQMKTMPEISSQLQNSLIKDSIERHYHRTDVEKGSYKMLVGERGTSHERTDTQMEKYYNEDLSALVNGIYADDIILLKKLMNHPGATDYLKNKVREQLFS